MPQMGRNKMIFILLNAKGKLQKYRYAFSLNKQNKKGTKATCICNVPRKMSTGL